MTNNFSNALSDGAVIGSVAIVITIIVTVAVILLILFMLYRRKKLNSPKNDRTIAINNNTYDSIGKVKLFVATRYGGLYVCTTFKHHTQFHSGDGQYQGHVSLYPGFLAE